LNACQSKSPRKSALHWAVHDKNKKIVEMLISLKVDVDVIDEDGNTPLSDSIFAFKNDDSFFISLLIKNGADMHIENVHGISPLELSKMISNYNSTQYLVTK
jgi:ankyrin repeat protein